MMQVWRIVIIFISKLLFSTVNIFLTKILWLDVFTQKRVNKEDGEMKNQHEAEDHIFLLPAKTKPSILFCLDICYVDFFCCLRIYILWSFYLLVSIQFSEIIWLIEWVKSNIKLNEINNTWKIALSIEFLMKSMLIVRIDKIYLHKNEMKHMIFCKTCPIKMSSNLSNFQFT